MGVDKAATKQMLQIAHLYCKYPFAVRECRFVYADSRHTMCVMAALLGLSAEFPFIVVHNREEARMPMCSMHPVACNPIPLPLSSLSKQLSGRCVCP